MKNQTTRKPLEVLRLYREHNGSVFDIFESRSAQDPGRPFLWWNDATINWTEARERALRLSTVFINRGIKKGSRVSIMARNSPEHVLMLLALARIGAIMVPVNPDFGVEETRYLMELADVSAVICSEETLPVAREACAKLDAWFATLGNPVEEVPSLGQLADSAELDHSPSMGCANDACIIIFTSGSTGFPKAVVHSQSNFVTAGEGFVSRLNLQEWDRLLAILPLYHINATFYSVSGTLAAGASLALIPKFSASGFWELAVRSQATQVNFIEAIGSILKARPREEFRTEHRIRAIYGVRPQFVEFFRNEFQVPTNVGGYGMSEIPGVTSTPLDRPNKPGAMGVLCSHPDPERAWATCRIVDDEGVDLPDDEIGELWVKTPIVMQGYFNDPVQTREAFVDGWFKTGDLVRRDADGFFYFVSRKQDIIRRRGENISAAEIDRIVQAHPGVYQVGTIAVPSELGEDEILCAVVRMEDSDIQATEIAQWCTERLAKMKVPRYIVFLPELPYTPTMKVAKAILRKDKTLKERAVDLLSTQ